MDETKFLLRPSEKLINNWGWFFFLGILLIIAGAIGCAANTFATFVFVYFVGFMLLFAGILQVFQCFYTSGWRNFFLWLIAGLIYVAAGIICFTNPFASAQILTILLGFFLIIAGVFRLMVGFSNKHVAGYGWVVFSAILSLLLGFMVIFQWQESWFWMLGLFFSIDILFQGFSWVAIGLGLKSLKDK